MNANPVNLWTESQHAREYLERADLISHRGEGEAALLEFIPRGAKRILDLGTGDGRLLALVRREHPETEAVALDFSPAMLEEGLYFGLRQGGDLVAAAGTHLVVPQEGVAAIGNVYTRRDRRGHGLGGAVTGAVTAELLHNGDASILYQSLVKDKKVAASVSGGDNWPLGNAFEYNGPTLMTSFIVYPGKVNLDQLLSAYDATIAELAKKGPTKEQVDRIAAKMRSDWYDNLEIPINRASALSHAVLFDGSFDGVYQIPDRVANVTPEQVRNFAAKYLVPSNRTIINRVPAADKNAAAPGGQQ